MPLPKAMPLSGETGAPVVLGTPGTASGDPGDATDWPGGGAGGGGGGSVIAFKALLTEGGPQVKSGLIWRVFTPQPGPNGARKLVSTHRDAMP
ncbi:MAG: hypothetical protein WBE89_09770, partial [Methyloceanibacter sp.]